MMLKCLFSVNFFIIFSLSLLFSTSVTAQYHDTNTLYTSRKGGFIICDAEGLEELKSIRRQQIAKGKEEEISLASESVVQKISQCMFRNTKVLFKRVATEHNLEAREIMVFDKQGEENCPSNLLKRCRRDFASPLKYVESIYLGKDGQTWYGPVFVEMGPSFELLDRPEDTQAGEQDRVPNN